MHIPLNGDVLSVALECLVPTVTLVSTSVLKQLALNMKDIFTEFTGLFTTGVALARIESMSASASVGSIMLWERSWV